MSAVAQQLAARKLYGGGENSAPSYLAQEVMLWSPEKIILKTYDFFIVSCKRRDVSKMNKSLLHLMEALNFEYSEESTRLYRLYEYCQKCIFQRRYDEALHIIEGLRQAWAAGFKLD
jgi:flagellin-specific chaperone FliS